MKVITLSCRCKLSSLVPQVRQYVLTAAPQPAAAPTGRAATVRALNLPPAA